MALFFKRVKIQFHEKKLKYTEIIYLKNFIFDPTSSYRFLPKFKK